MVTGDSINVGDAAEDEVRLWASKSGIVVNSSQRDRGGWDHRFQLRVDQEEPKPLDHRPPEIVCDVQVKGTKAPGTSSVAVKLSNWERHAKSPLPFFFAVLVYESTGSVRDAYLIHLDRDWVSRVLRRLRKESGKGGDASPLHKQTLSISLREEDRIDPEPQGLRAAIVRHVGNPLKYARSKLEWIAESGYETERYRGVMTFSDQVEESDFADLALGLRDALPVKRLKLDEVRFGIGVEQASHEGELEVSFPNLPSLGETKVVLANTSDGRECRLTTETLATPAVFPFLSERFTKVRCFNDYLSLVFGPSDDTVSISFGIDDITSKVSLLTVARVAQFARILATSAPKDIRIELFLPRAVKASAVFKLPSAPELRSDFLDLCRVLEATWRLVRKAGCSEEILVNPAELWRWRDQILPMAGALDSGHGNATMEPTKLPSGDDAAILVQTVFGCGDLALIGAIVLRGRPHVQHTGPIAFEVDGSTELAGLWSVDRNAFEDWKTNERRALFTKIVDDLEAQDCEVFVPDDLGLTQ